MDMGSPEFWRWVWLVAAAVFAIGEMAIAGSFFLAPFAIGAVVAAILAFAGVPVGIEWLAFAAVSAGAGASAASTAGVSTSSAAGVAAFFAFFVASAFFAAAFFFGAPSAARFAFAASAFSSFSVFGFSSLVT